MLENLCCCLKNKNFSDTEEGEEFFMRTVSKLGRHIFKQGNNCDALNYNDTLFVVADGVSSVNKSNFDASLLPKELVNLCIKECEHIRLQADVDLPRLIALRALRRCRSRGSTTLCIGCVYKHKLMVFNVGDSKMIQLRKINNITYQVISSTVSQQYSFNTPYQINTMRLKNIEYVINQVHDIGCSSTHPLKVGDLIIFATDGLYDNISESDICGIINNTVEEDLQGIVDSLYHVAASSPPLDLFNPDFSLCYKSTPFSESVSKHYDLPDRGGSKPDDIAIILTKVF